jgi:hypothetical protein
VRLRRTIAHSWAVAACIIAALLSSAAPAAASPSAAACQEYVVCGQPSGGVPGGGGTAPKARSSPASKPGPSPSVASRTDLPLTSYPLTPAIAIPGVVLVAGLFAGLVIGLGRRGGRGEEPPAATSAQAR